MRAEPDEPGAVGTGGLALGDAAPGRVATGSPIRIGRGLAIDHEGKQLLGAVIGELHLVPNRADGDRAVAGTGGLRASDDRDEDQRANKVGSHGCLLSIPVLHKRASWRALPIAPNNAPPTISVVRNGRPQYPDGDPGHIPQRISYPR